MRVAVVDIGTNSTRLLIADVDPASGSLRELVRRSEVTRLGARRGRRRARSPTRRPRARLRDARRSTAQEIDAHGCEANIAVLTSAVRDADQRRRVRRARARATTASTRACSAASEEAQLTFLGAMSGRPAADGADGRDRHRRRLDRVRRRRRPQRRLSRLAARRRGAHERAPHPHRPARAGGAAGARRRRSRDLSPRACPRTSARRSRAGIAVAGTATSAASIDQELDPYDPERVHGYPLLLGDGRTAARAAGGDGRSAAPARSSA